jgi:hypothetical protein
MEFTADRVIAGFVASRILAAADIAPIFVPDENLALP